MQIAWIESRSVLVTNIHYRTFSRDKIAAIGALIDGLAAPDDALWPHEVWPAMRFDRPLGVGADGGHGPVRYAVCAYSPGRHVAFRFKSPRGFVGTHRFDVLETDAGIELRHTLAMDTRGPALVTWPLIFRPLHDAVLEDCLAKAQAVTGEAPDVVAWPLSVRVWRRLFSRKRPRPQAMLLAALRADRNPL